MKRILILLCAILFVKASSAANGDSVFQGQTVHSLYITFPYPTFYDSLLNSHATDIYLEVSITYDGTTINNVGIKAKGNSSFNNPSQKKPFKLDFNEFVSGQKLDGLKKLNFNNAFKDPSFVREKLANDFLIDHQVPAPRTAYCNVYMNNQLWGIYNVVENVDGDFCDRWFGNEDGNLFKGDPHGDLRWKGAATQSLYEPEYELKNNEVANDWTDLIDLINVINNTADNVYYNTLDGKLNLYNFVRQWAALNLFSSLDSYIGSGHNYYVYHNTNTGKFEWISWDANEIFGSFKMNLSATQLKNLDMYFLDNAANKPLCNKMLLNATCKAMYNDAYCELENDFTNAALDAKIDSLRNLIQQDVYNDPKKFYGNTKFDSSFNYDLVLSGPGGLTVFGIKNFIATRNASAQASLATNNVICTPLGTGNIEEENSYNIFPNPVSAMVSITSTQNFQHIRVCSMDGKTVIDKTFGSCKQFTLDMGNLNSGIYLMQVDDHKVIKLVKD